jgi:hypothetical protein
LLSVTTLEDYNVYSVDVKTAYLYGDLDEEIYMEQPEGFKLPGKGNKVWRLCKALYSLKQAGLSWWKALSASMMKLGFKCCKSDTGIYVYIHPKTQGQIYAVVYIDDVIFMGPKGSLLLNELKQKFMKTWECHNQGELDEFLGMHIQQDQKNCQLYIDQEKYLEVVLKCFDVSGKSANTPLVVGFEFEAYTGQVSPQVPNKIPAISHIADVFDDRITTQHCVCCGKIIPAICITLQCALLHKTSGKHHFS